MVNTAINKGTAFKPKRGANRRTNSIWRINSFVGDPTPVTADGASRETTRIIIAATAINPAAAVG
jgi:hypothetical protein